MTQTNFSLPSHLSSALDSAKANLQNMSSITTAASDVFNFTEDASQIATTVERELECQICLGKLENPILLACNAHSLCLNCIIGLFEHQKKVKGGKRHIYCPSCGHDSGSIALKKSEEFRVNKELERVMEAYEKEKAMWFEEKFNLKQQLYAIVNIKEEENNKKLKNEKAGRRGLANEEEECLRDIIKDFGAQKLKQVEKMIQESLTNLEKATKGKIQRKNTKSTRASDKNKNNGDEEDGEESDDEEVVTTNNKRGGRGNGSQTKILDYIGNSKVVKRGRPAKKNTMEVESKEEKREYSLRNNVKRLKTF